MAATSHGGFALPPWLEAGMFLNTSYWKQQVTLETLVKNKVDSTTLRSAFRCVKVSLMVTFSFYAKSIPILYIQSAI